MYRLFTIVWFSLFGQCCDGQQVRQLSKDAGLKQHYSGYFPVGVSVSPANLAGDEAGMIIKHFNSITAENAMKFGKLQPREDSFYWKDADSIVAFAQRNGMKVRGHTLVWHQETPDWLFLDADGDTVSKQVLLQRLEKHIKTVVGRYKGKVYAWDVVNEAVSNNKGEYLRNTPWLRICGEEYIARAFAWAHEADKNALLFYNDYNEIVPEKRSKIIRLVKDLQEKGVPIHGIALQAHWSINAPTKGQLETTIEELAALNLPLQVTELDVSVYPKIYSNKDKEDPDTSRVFTARREKEQLELYRNVFDVFRRNKHRITGVTFWNVSDRKSWLDNFPVKGRKDYPLLFDANLKPKKAFHAIVPKQDP